MKHMKNPRIVTSMFLIDCLTVVNLISASPFFNIRDDQGSGIVYIYCKNNLILGKKQYMKETSGSG